MGDPEVLSTSRVIGQSQDLLLRLQESQKRIGAVLLETSPGAAVSRAAAAGASPPTSSASPYTPIRAPLAFGTPAVSAVSAASSLARGSPALNTAAVHLASPANVGLGVVVQPRFRPPPSDDDGGVAQIEDVMSRMTSQAHRDAQAIDRLKGELQRVIAELRNRDKELNSMSAAHSRQMESWAQDKRKANELDASVKRLAASEAALKSEIDTLRRDLQAATAQVQQLQAAQSTSTAEKSALQQQAQQAAERLQQVAAELETNQKQSQSVEQLVKQLYDSVTTLHSRETHLQERMRALEEENKVLRQDVQQGSQLRDELDRRLREAQERAASEQARADAAVAEAARKDGDIAKLRQLVTEAQSFNAELEAKMASTVQEVTALRDELLLASERDRRSTQLDALRKSKEERYEGELQRLRQLLDQQTTENSALQAQLDSLRDLTMRQEEELQQHRAAAEHRQQSMRSFSERLCNHVSEALSPHRSPAGGASARAAAAPQPQPQLVPDLSWHTLQQSQQSASSAPPDDTIADGLAHVLTSTPMRPHPAPANHSPQQYLPFQQQPFQPQPHPQHLSMATAPAGPASAASPASADALSARLQNMIRETQNMSQRLEQSTQPRPASAAFP